MRFSLASSALLALAATGCQQTDPSLDYKLQKLEDKLDAIDRRLASLPSGPARPAAAAPAARPQPPQADPNAVYSVAIGDSPSRGPANAKVTIVEAADFA